MKRFEMEELWNRHSSIVAMLAYQFQPKICSNAMLEIADLVQEGTIAFVHALKEYKPERGCTFRTFLYTAIKARFTVLLKESYCFGKNVRVINIEDIQIVTRHHFSQLEMDELKDTIRSKLNARQQEVFDHLVDPPDGLWVLAILYQAEKLVQYKRGHRVRGQNVLKITHKMVAEYLGISESEMCKVVNDIKNVLIEEGIKPSVVNTRNNCHSYLPAHSYRIRPKRDWEE